MATLSRFQLDLSSDELSSIDRWSSLAGFRTKKEFLINAFTLFKWAAQQVLLGRTICAVNEATGEIRHLEMPALAAIAECAGRAAGAGGGPSTTCSTGSTLVGDCREPRRSARCRNRWCPGLKTPRLS